MQECHLKKTGGVCHPSYWVFFAGSCQVTQAIESGRRGLVIPVTDFHFAVIREENDSYATVDSVLMTCTYRFWQGSIALASSHARQFSSGKKTPYSTSVHSTAHIRSSKFSSL
ncbi:hypothetical protein JG688_00008463 [Phytophthora aleatoria]|uniref:Uncharacterized protein n=1 Tax=Phytophthora aleatoria TaxID=2496075 RepID=A0A8J5II82_9STRA|nr:hypothetical protein JG688_00008463 [Phytophthora aleatoria]